MPLIKVPYDINSNVELIRVCLEMKRYDALHTVGFGPHSCSAHLKYMVSGIPYYSYGNSRIKMEVEAYKPDGSDKYKNSEIACHGESSAIMAALGAIKTSSLAGIQELYVELSPCAARCQGFLANVNPALNIYYSFDHPGEVPAWKIAAKNLCK